MPSQQSRALRLLELLDRGERSVTDLAEMLGVDKSTASRTLAELEADGWVTRAAGVLQLGPRAWVLGRGGEGELRVRRAEQVAGAAAAATGLWVQVVQLVGRSGYLLADVRPPGAASTPVDSTVAEFPLWATATGHCLLAQLDPQDVASALPRQPYPAETRHTLTTSGEVTERVASIRAGALAFEVHEYVEGWGCVAAPWPREDRVGPWAIAATGWADTVLQQRPSIERVLRQAVRADATTDLILASASATPQDGRQ